MTPACCDRSCASAERTVDFRRFQLGLGDQFLRRELLGARELRSRVIERHAEALEIGFRPDQVGAGLLNLRLDERRIEAREHLAFADQRVEIGIQLLDGAGHLRAHLHCRDRLQRAGRANRLGEVPAGDARRGNRRRHSGFCEYR